MHTLSRAHNLTFIHVTALTDLPAYIATTEQCIVRNRYYVLMWTRHVKRDCTSVHKISRGYSINDHSNRVGFLNVNTVCLFVCQLAGPMSAHLCVCMYVCMYVCMSVCLSVCMSVCLCLSVSLFVCLSVRLSVCLYVRLAGFVLVDPTLN